MKTKQKRPKFLNLFAIHLPVTGVTSFAHRVSGALMFLAIPAAIYLFGLSLRDADSFNAVLSLLHAVPVKILDTILAWSIAHHTLAGIRFLLMDVSLGGDALGTIKAGAWAINLAGLALALIIASQIWL